MFCNSSIHLVLKALFPVYLESCTREECGTFVTKPQKGFVHQEQPGSGVECEPCVLWVRTLCVPPVLGPAPQHWGEPGQQDLLLLARRALCCPWHCEESLSNASLAADCTLNPSHLMAPSTPSAQCSCPAGRGCLAQQSSAQPTLS